MSPGLVAYTIWSTLALGVGGVARVEVQQDGSIGGSSSLIAENTDVSGKLIRNIKQAPAAGSAKCAQGACCNVAAPAHGMAGDCGASLRDGQECQPACDENYVSSGKYSCRNGSLKMSTCMVAGCLAGPPPANGSYGRCPLVGTPLVDGATCQPNCSPGFVLRRNATCSFGTFSAGICAPAPCTSVRVPQCSPIGTTPCSGAGTCLSVLESGTSCLPVCAAGWTLTPPATMPVSTSAPLQYHCNLGVLQMSSCQPASCHVTPVEIPEGSMTHGTCPLNLPSGTSCEPQCLPDKADPTKLYALNPAKKLLTCNHGNFTAIAECAPAACDLRVELSQGLANGDISSCPAVLPHGKTCAPTCKPGYTLNNKLLTCSYGKLEPPTCEPTPCTFAMPAAAEQSDCPHTVPSGSSCGVTCEPGFEARGMYKCEFGKFIEEGPCVPMSCSLTLGSHEQAGDCPIAPNIMQAGSQCMLTCAYGMAAKGKTICDNGKLVQRTQCDNSPCVVPPDMRSGSCGEHLPLGSNCTPACAAGQTLESVSICDQNRVFTAGLCVANPDR